MSLSERDKYLEELLVEHCAPTLAAIKTGNLFSVSYDSAEQLDAVIKIWNRRFSRKGVTLSVLKNGNNRAMLYVHRKDKLMNDFKKTGVKEFLKSCGYADIDPDSAVDTLRKRISECDSFPHEIGLFLSYPLGDVIGFIANGGRNCKLCGYWKVYCNETDAEKQFERYSKCRDVYSKLRQRGRSVLQLTV